MLAYSGHLTLQTGRADPEAELAQHGGFASNQGAVFFGATVMELYDVDILTNTFKVKLNIGMRWYDPQFVTPEFREVHNVLVETATQPVLCFANCVEMIEQPWETTKL